GYSEKASLNTSEETINLAFATDRFIKFSDELARNTVVKLMVLLHYSAIIFHCARIVKKRNLEKPEYISLSGNGSRALNALEPSPDKNALAAPTSRILRLVYDHWDGIAENVPATTKGVDDAVRRKLMALADTPSGPLTRLKLLFADRLKEATCEGGLFW